MKHSYLITFTFWTFLLIIGILVLNYFLKQEQFATKTMVTNIQHDPSHKTMSHGSREHPDSHLKHEHKDNSDRLRFN